MALAVISPADEDRLVEHGVLVMVLALHPEHLTISELMLEMATEDDQMEGEAVLQAIRTLRASGVLRYTGDVVEPTRTAVRINELLDCP